MEALEVDASRAKVMIAGLKERDFIKETFQKFAGDFPFTQEFLLDEVDQMYAKDVRLASILGSFAFLALLISCLGIYGLARFSVPQKEDDFFAFPVRHDLRLQTFLPGTSSSPTS